MEALRYDESGVGVRDELRRAHAEILTHVTAPGTWWTGAERRALALESRNGASCRLCRERKTALSPSAVGGEHDSLGLLPDGVVDAVHRIRTDPGRLSRAWFESVLAAGMSEEQYVELVGVVTLVAGVDYFARALGVPPAALPPARAGEPTRHRPAGARPGTAWVATIDPADAVGAEADLYAGSSFVPNIMRALSLVPDQVRALIRSSNAHYFEMDTMVDPLARRDLDRLGIELVASRVSALNECFY